MLLSASNLHASQNPYLTTRIYTQGYPQTQSPRNQLTKPLVDTILNAHHPVPNHVIEKARA